MAGGLMRPDSVPGEATPKSLYQLYKAQGAIMANPCTLRQQFGMAHCQQGQMTNQQYQQQQQRIRNGSVQASQQARSIHAIQQAMVLQNQRQQSMAFDMRSLVQQREAGGSRRRSDSPPRMQFRVLQDRGIDTSRASSQTGSLTLSLASLNMNRGS